MMRLTPATRAIVFSAGLVLATTSTATMSMAGAAEPEATAEAPAQAAVEAPAEVKPADPFMPTIYVGPSFGYADQDNSSNFAWSMQVLARPIQYLGLQIEYLNLGSDHNDVGHIDGVYFGVAPMYAITNRFDLYGQVGLVVGDPGEDVAAGLGVMFKVPFEFLETNNVDLEIRADYKYLNWDSGDNMVTLGFMLGFHK